MDRTDAPDSAPDGRWLTYDEIATARGIKRIGAVRLVQRHKWRRQAGNDGLAGILVPHDALQTVPRTSAGTNAPTAAGNAAAADDPLRYLAAMQTAHAGEITALRREVEIYRGLLDSLGETHASEIAALRTALEAETGELAAFRGLLDRRLAELEGDLDTARAQAQAAQEVADALRGADNARQALGLLARLRSAWRGE